MRKRGKTESHLLIFQTGNLQRLQKLGDKGSKILICFRIRHQTSSLLGHWPLEGNLFCLMQLCPWAARNATLPESENEFKISVYGNHFKGRRSGSYFYSRTFSVLPLYFFTSVHRQKHSFQVHKLNHLQSLICTITHLDLAEF